MDAFLPMPMLAQGSALDDVSYPKFAYRSQVAGTFEIQFCHLYTNLQPRFYVSQGVGTLHLRSVVRPQLPRMHKVP